MPHPRFNPRLPLLAVLILLGVAGPACHSSEALATPGPLPGGVVPAGQPADPQLKETFWDAPDFAFTDQDGKPFRRSDLLGHVSIADYIYTHCTSACPVLTSKMKLVQRHVDDPAVRFISFSVDPEHDTPAALKAYAQQWRLDERQWRLLVPPDDQKLKSFVDGMKTEVQRNDDPENPIMHSERLVLIDGQGRVRGLFDSTSPEDLTTLAADARLLEGHAGVPVTTAGSGAEQGKQLAESLGCLACHAQPAVAPHLEGVAGSTVKLSDGTQVVADPSYLRESIVDPERQVVAGYNATMPSYRGQLTDGQIDSLVAFVGTLGAQPAPTLASARITAVDPVCGMKISAGAESPHATLDGTTYYFCSEACQTKFLANPKSHLPASPPR